MDAYVSGQAASAVTIDGPVYFLLRYDDGVESIRVTRNDLARVFRGCTDVIHLKNVGPASVEASLKKSWKRDRVLRLVLIALDADDDEDDRAAALALLNDFCDADAAAWAVDQMCAEPLAPEASGLARSYAGRPTAVAPVFAELLALQSGIERTVAAWNDLSDDLFSSAAHRTGFKEVAIVNRVFGALSRSTPGTDDANKAIFSAHKELKELEDSRSIITAWTKALAAPRRHRAIESETFDDYDDGFDTKPLVGNRDAYEAAIRQIRDVADRLRLGQVSLARKRASELISNQISSSGREYAAKSLCSLAQIAKGIGLYDLQLEWTQRAVDIAPMDPKVHGHAADALIHFNRLDEALAHFAKTGTLGEPGFAASGPARVLRAQNRIEEALAAFREAYKAYPHGESAMHILRGIAETLRDMSKWDEARAAYDEAIALFPDDRSLKCGRAAVLADQGRLHESLAAYDNALLKAPRDVVARNGRATVLRHLGLLPEARSAYKEVISDQPFDSVARCGTAEVTRLMGEHARARDEYASIIRDFPHVPVAYCGLAETLRDMGKVQDSIAVYKDAVGRFPKDIRLAVGHALAYRAGGQYQEALRLLDLTVRDFPFDLVSRLNRAELLKRLDRTGEAVSAYEAVLATVPDHVRARTALAALFAVRGDLTRAQTLLPTVQPVTEDEWMAFHVSGMVLYRAGRNSEALARFERGLKSPYARIRQQSQNAIAMAKINLRQFSEARTALRTERSVAPTPSTNILNFHVAAALGRKERYQLHAALKLEKLPLVQAVHPAIAANCGMGEAQQCRPQKWVEEKLFEVVLLDAA